MILKLTVLFFLILDSVGNVPFFVSVLRHFDYKRQFQIILRELLIALAVMIFFLFFGEAFFKVLKIKQGTLELMGGIVLFMIALKMLFSRQEKLLEKRKKELKEPMIVPLAIPAVAGPGILATIVLYAGQDISKWTLLLVIIISWSLSAPILLLAPYIKKTIGENGSTCVERIFGYLVILISVQMILSGALSSFR